MAELTREQLEQAVVRADTYSLADSDVALQTADTMPAGSGIEGTKLDTAGSDQHGPVYSYTVGDVRTALDKWDSRDSRERRPRRTGGTRKGRRTGNGRRSAKTTTTRAPARTEVPDTTQTPPVDQSDDTTAEASEGKG
jgi:hypothetical protein